MDGLLRFAHREGLTEEEAQKALRLNRPVTEGGWVDAEDMGSESLLIAKAGMEAGRYLEYACYESTGAPQGRGVLKPQSWEEEGVLRASHGECSDKYYQWYVDHDIREKGAVYHVCTGKHSTCRFKLPRGDRRILIHLDRWRLLSPATMVLGGYMKEKGETWGRVVLKEAATAKLAGGPPQGVQGRERLQQRPRRGPPLIHRTRQDGRCVRQRIGLRAQRRVQRKGGLTIMSEIRSPARKNDAGRGPPTGKDERKTAQRRTRARVADEILPRILREPGPHWAVCVGHEGVPMNRPPVRILKGRLMHMMRRGFKMNDAPFQEGGYQKARHFKPAPGGGAGLLRGDVRTATAKAENQAPNLRKSRGQLKKNK